MTGVAHSAPIFELAGWTTVGVGIADRGRHLLGDIPLLPVLHAGPKRPGWLLFAVPWFGCLSL
jgi:hypothetical protein